MPRKSTTAKMTPVPASGKIGMSDINCATRAAKNSTQTAYKSGYEWNSKNGMLNLIWYLVTRGQNHGSGYNQGHGNTEFMAMDDAAIARGFIRVDNKRRGAGASRGKLRMSAFRGSGMAAMYFRMKARTQLDPFDINSVAKDGAVAFRGLGMNNRGTQSAGDAVWDFHIDGVARNNIESTGTAVGSSVTGLGINYTNSGAHTFSLSRCWIRYLPQSGSSYVTATGGTTNHVHAGTFQDFTVLLSSRHGWGPQVSHGHWYHYYGFEGGDFYNYFGVYKLEDGVGYNDQQTGGDGRCTSGGYWSYSVTNRFPKSNTSHRLVPIADFRFGSGAHTIRISASNTCRVRIGDLGFDQTVTANHASYTDYTLSISDDDARYQKIEIDLTSSSTSGVTAGVAIAIWKNGTDSAAYTPTTWSGGGEEEKLVWSTTRIGGQYNRNTYRGFYGGTGYSWVGYNGIPADWCDQVWVWPGHMEYMNKPVNGAPEYMLSNHFTKHAFRTYSINEVQ